MDKRRLLQVTVPEDHQHSFYAGTQGEMTYGGVFVELARPPAPGTPVEVAIVLPDGGRVRAHGSVRWIRTPDVATAESPTGCGVAWQAIDRKSVQAVPAVEEPGGTSPATGAEPAPAPTPAGGKIVFACTSIRFLARCRSRK